MPSTTPAAAPIAVSFSVGSSSPPSSASCLFPLSSNVLKKGRRYWTPVVDKDAKEYKRRCGDVVRSECRGGEDGVRKLRARQSFGSTFVEGLGNTNVRPLVMLRYYQRRTALVESSSKHLLGPAEARLDLGRFSNVIQKNNLKRKG